MSLFDSASLVITPNGTKASKLYAIKPTDGSGDLSVTRATTATRVNSSGLIETVSANVPRLDYSNGSCPSVLVEPQRTNLFTWSEDLSNVVWTKSNATITANATTAPNGTTTADLLLCNTNTAGTNYVRQYKSISDNTHTLSFYAKANASSIVKIAEAAYTGQQLDFDLSTNTISGSGSQVSGTITDSVNGWKKITFTYVYTSGQTDCYLNINSLSCYLWGMQLEAGSYATSYIPTTSASVTRNADVISKTGISSLIGQTEGTMFIDFNIDNIAAQTNDPILLSFNASNYIEIFDNGRVNYYDGSGNIDINLPSYGLTNGRHKFAIAYNTNDVAFYIDGSLAGTDTSCTPSAKSDLYLTYINSNFYGMFEYNVTALWKTRLSNTELATLTTI